VLLVVSRREAVRPSRVEQAFKPAGQDFFL